MSSKPRSSIILIEVNHGSSDLYIHHPSGDCLVDYRHDDDDDGLPPHREDDVCYLRQREQRRRRRGRRRRHYFIAGALFVAAMTTALISHNIFLQSTTRQILLTRSSRTQKGIEEESSFRHSRRRRLFSLASFMDPKSVALSEPFGAGDVHSNERHPSMPSSSSSSSSSSTSSRMAERHRIPSLSPYDRHNIMITPQAFARELFILYYDPSEDIFLIYIDESKDPYMSNVWSPVWNRLNVVGPILTNALRRHFGERFGDGAGGGSKEFVVLFSTGDTPKLTCDCVIVDERQKRPFFCRNDAFAPILQFGSVYKDASILPNAITMPVWPHLPCMAEWQKSESICEELRIQSDVAGVYGREEALAAPAATSPGGGTMKQMPFSIWDALIPTIIWRGSDYVFMQCIHPRVRPVDWPADVAPRIARFGDNPRGVVQLLMETMWDKMTPRWRGATLTAMAELDVEDAGGEAREDREGGGSIRLQQRHYVPWIDAKFRVKDKIHGRKAEPMNDRYMAFEEYGIPMTDEVMTLSELSKYKYHIDLGGGGGTTWFGTMEKLAMPGVLFHHVTSAKDYFHDDLVPWIHYIPVNEDLSDLREMFDWAEANSDKAQKISEAGTEYIKNLAQPRVMKATYERYFVHSLKVVVDAYQPMKDEDAKRNMKEWLSTKFSLVGRCSGNDEKCELKDWKANGGEQG